jgi:uncharacterized protein
MLLEKQKVDQIRNYFSNRPVLKAYLFGSYVRGQADENSDLDILVDLDYSKKIGLEFIQMQLDLKSMLGVEVDLVSSNGLSPYIQQFIDGEKMLIYVR